MARPPQISSREERQVIAKLQRDLERFRQVPQHRREAEHADEGEATCRQLLSELGAGPEGDEGV